MGDKGIGKRQEEKSVGYLKYHIDKTWGGGKDSSKSATKEWKSFQN